MSSSDNAKLANIFSLSTPTPFRRNKMKIRCVDIKWSWLSWYLFLVSVFVIRSAIFSVCLWCRGRVNHKTREHPCKNPEDELLNYKPDCLATLVLLLHATTLLVFSGCWNAIEIESDDDIFLEMSIIFTTAFSLPFLFPFYFCLHTTTEQLCMFAPRFHVHFFRL